MGKWNHRQIFPKGNSDPSLLEHFVKTKSSRDSGIGESLKRNSKYGQCQNMYFKIFKILGMEQQPYFEINFLN